MTRPTPAQIAFARQIVTQPNQFAAKPALRANAWETLMAVKGLRVDLPRLDQITADLRRKGVA